MLAGQRSCAGRTAQAPAPCRARTHKSASLSGRPRPRPRPRPSPTRACALQRGCVAAPKAAAPRNVPIPLIPARSVAAWGITAGTILGLCCAHIDPHSCAAAPSLPLQQTAQLSCAAIEPLTAHYDCLPVRHCPARAGFGPGRCEESTSSTEACLPVSSAPFPRADLRGGIPLVRPSASL